MASTFDPPFTSYPGEVRFFALPAPDIRATGPIRRIEAAVSDQMTADKRQKAVAALRAAEVKAALAVRLDQQGKTGEGSRGLARDHGQIFSDELSMASPISARRHGDDFQARLFYPAAWRRCSTRIARS